MIDLTGPLREEIVLKPKPKTSTSTSIPTLIPAPIPTVHRKRGRRTLASADRASSVICLRASAEWRAWLEDTAQQAGLPGPLDLIDEALRSFAAAQRCPAGPPRIVELHRVDANNRTGPARIECPIVVKVPIVGVPAWKAWVDALGALCGLQVSRMIERACRDWAASRSLPDPPSRLELNSLDVPANRE